MISCLEFHFNRDTPGGVWCGGLPNINRAVLGVNWMSPNIPGIQDVIDNLNFQCSFKLTLAKHQPSRSIENIYYRILILGRNEPAPLDTEYPCLTSLYYLFSFLQIFDLHEYASRALLLGGMCSKSFAHCTL